MTPIHKDALCTLYHGDCVEVMRELPAESVDAVVTDPPYGLEFMGKEWDRLGDVARALRGATSGLPVGPGSGRGTSPTAGRPGFDLTASSQRKMQAWHEAWAREAFRVAKPGAYLVAAGGTRTFHRLVSAIEDAGWEIRDTMIHCYASGFPKSASVAKASTVQSWAALLPSAPHSSGTPEGSQDGYRSGCRLCGQPLQPVSVVVQEPERLSGGAPGCSHPSAPSVDIQLGSGRTYRACHACLSCRPSTPDCAHLASAQPEPPVAPATNGAGESGRKHHADEQQLSLHQTPDDGTPDRSSDASPSEAKPRRSGRGSRTAHRGQTEAYTHSTLGCPSCHEAYAQQAVEYAGFGTALKPSFEPWTLARKPLRGTVAANVLRYSTGAINVDATRIGTDATQRSNHGGTGNPEQWRTGNGHDFDSGSPAGRWPANLILTDPIFDGDTPGVVGGGSVSGVGGAYDPSSSGASSAVFTNHGPGVRKNGIHHGDSGTYSRFFLIPKSSRADREPLVRGGLEPVEGGAYANGKGMPGRTLIDGEWVQTGTWEEPNRKARANTHPTTKPTDLMRHLVRLVTPPKVACLACLDCGTVVEWSRGKAPTDTNTVPPLRRPDSDGSREPDAVLLEAVRGSVERPEPTVDEGLREDGSGLHSGLPAGASDGNENGLRDAAPPDHGRSAGPEPHGGRGRRSHQRDQGRQPAGESAGDAEAGTRQPTEAATQADRVPELPLDDLHHGSCPACGGRLAASTRPGVILDCFLGSGTTAIAANAEGFRCIGIEKEREYLDIALARMAHQPLGLGLDVAAPTRKSVLPSDEKLAELAKTYRMGNAGYRGGWSGEK